MTTKNNSSILFLRVFYLLLFPFLMTAQKSEVGSYTTDLEGRSVLEITEAEVSKAPMTAPSQMPSWPKYMDTSGTFSPSGVSLVDINGNGSLEIIAGSTDGSMHVWDYEGNELPGWPLTGLEIIQSKVAVGDFDPDFTGLEIISVGRDSKLYAWHNDGTAVAGWPLTISQTNGLKPPVLFDIDNDGDLEIILVQTANNGQVIIFNHDGTIYPGWPQPVDYLGVAPPAVGDIDNDGEIEICAVSYYSIYLWDKDGVLKPGWPKLNIAPGMSYAQPIFADIDNDGIMEIIHTYYGSSGTLVGIYNYDGTNYGTWPKPYAGNQPYTMPIPSDLDNDGDLEIFGGGHTTQIGVRHHTGEYVSGWPTTIPGIGNLESSPIMIDIDNDGELEVVIADTAGSNALFHAYNADGSVVTDWPFSSGGSSNVNSAAAGDVDGDGDIEIALVIGTGVVNLWTIENIPFHGYLADWSTFYHDSWNTGWMHPSKPKNLTGNYTVGFPNHLSWDANVELDIAGYNIYRSNTSGGNYTKINTSLVIDTFYDDATGTVDDFYRITAEIKAHTESRLSNETNIILSTTSYSNQPLTIYPNPSNETIHIKSSIAIGEVTLSIFDINGKKVYNQETSLQNTITINTGNLNSGLYIIHIEGNNYYYTEKLIIK